MANRVRVSERLRHKGSKLLERHQTLIVVLVAALLVLGPVALYLLVLREADDRTFETMEERFLYGSIGTEAEVGLPFDIWEVLPELFPQHLPAPGGYESLGFIWPDGEETPIGVTRRTIGTLSRAGINCATCHTATYRTDAGQTESVVVAGGPTGRLDIQAYQRFLTAAAADPGFTADALIEAIGKRKDLSALDRLEIKALVPVLAKALQTQGENFEWADANPDWGAGRIDPFNPVKYGLLELPVDGTIGNSDNMSLWGLSSREGGALHWDGLNPDPTDVVLSSAIGDGATPKSLDLEYMAELEAWLRALEPPEFPFAIDQSLAAEGEQVFTANCASCHALGAGLSGAIIPLAEVGTDRHRVDMWTDSAVAAYGSKFDGLPFDFNRFQNVEGYVAVELNGIWLRAPYLHNGSVPNLVALLTPPDLRPATFYRGYDVYDPDSLGFVSDVAVDPTTGFQHFLFDTTLPGNSSQGHDYGTGLSGDQKRALVEFLKTL